MNFVRENFLLTGHCLRYKVPKATNFEDYFWRGSSGIIFADEFVQWQREGASAVSVNSVTAYDVPVGGFYSVRVDSPCVISEARKSSNRNKQLYFATAQLDPKYPVLQTTNNFILPISLSSAQSGFFIVVDIVPYYKPPSLETQGVPTRLNAYVTSPEKDEKHATASFSPSDPVDVLPTFEVCLSFMRRTDDPGATARRR